MPILKPNKNESKKEFITRFMSKESMKIEFPDKKQRLAVAFSTWRKRDNNKKEVSDNLPFENKFCYKSIIEFKRDFVGGYIATTHFDGQDIILKTTLDKWADEINAANPRSNKVSYHHKRDKKVAGAGIKGTARVDQFHDGEYGLWVDTRLNKTHHELYNDLAWEIDNDMIDSYSIEYIAPEDVYHDENGVRILDEDTVLYGWTFASQPMNEHCVMVKELIKPKEENNIMETKIEEVQEKVEEIKQEEPVKEEPVVDKKPAAELEPKEKEIDPGYKEFVEWKEKSKKKKKYDELKSEIKEELKTELEKKSKKLVEEKVNINPGKMENKELIEFKEAMKVDSNLSFSSKIKMAGKMADMSNFAYDMRNLSVKDTKSISNRNYAFEIKEVDIHRKGVKFTKHCLEYKGLGLTTNQNADTDYLLSAAELSDVFDPVIYNALNQQTVTWNILRKDDYSNKGNNQVQFTLKTAANATASAYTGNSVALGNVTRLKYMTKFKKYHVGIEVDGDMIAAARGGPVGDVFAKEIADSTVDLLAVMNLGLYAEVGAETAAGVTGFEYITDSAGNPSLYNLTRSSTNKLAPDSAGDTYIDGASADITLANLRTAKRQCLKDGSMLGNLVYFTDHIQGDKFRGLYDNIQRTAPTSSRFGFEGRPEFDGIPIFEDKDCNDDDWFLVDLDSHRIAIWVPPTLEMLGKDSDSQKGFIKSYWCTYNRAPRRMVQIYSNATT